MATFDEKREYLESYAIVNRDIAILERRLQKEPVSAQQITDMPGGTSVGDPTGNLVVGAMEATRRLPWLYRRRAEILTTINNVDNGLYRQLLVCRYVDGLSHQETAQLLHVSRSVVEKSQRFAINSINI